MASYPWFDPNSFQTAPPSTFLNRSVTDPFEPGSVNKVITAAAAIQTNALPLTRVLQVPYAVRIGTYTIHDSHPHPVEGMTLGDIVAESSNVGATKIAGMLGANTMDSYLGRFGFGVPTGVGFPGEIGGDVPPLSTWSPVSLATIAFGQGLSVTPLQMTSVYSTVANGGVQVRPRLVQGTIEPNGAYQPTPTSRLHRVISDSTSQMLTRMLTYVVKDGTGVNAQISGYQVAGKTGTAQIPFVHRAGYSNKYMASFIGFLPASAPKVVVAVFIDQPTTQYGAIAAAPCFQRVARYAIQRLAIAPSSRVPLPPHVLRFG
jgi:cell division protein FtsI (penicillin-binding protein 3)